MWEDHSSRGHSALSALHWPPRTLISLAVKVGTERVTICFRVWSSYQVFRLKSNTECTLYLHGALQYSRVNNSPSFNVFHWFWLHTLHFGRCTTAWDTDLHSTACCKTWDKRRLVLSRKEHFIFLSEYLMHSLKKASSCSIHPVLPLGRIQLQLEFWNCTDPFRFNSLIKKVFGGSIFFEFSIDFYIWVSSNCEIYVPGMHTPSRYTFW